MQHIGAVAFLIAGSVAFVWVAAVVTHRRSTWTRPQSAAAALMANLGNDLDIPASLRREVQPQS